MEKTLEKEAAKKVSINFSKELWKQLKVRAAEEETTVTEILFCLLNPLLPS